MGRIRKTRKDLPPRVYLKHGAYYFVHLSGKWVRLAAIGQEREMRVAWANIEQPNETYGTVAALIDDYCVSMPQQQKPLALTKTTLKRLSI